MFAVLSDKVCKPKTSLNYHSQFDADSNIVYQGGLTPFNLRLTCWRYSLFFYSLILQVEFYFVSQITDQLDLDQRF